MVMTRTMKPKLSVWGVTLAIALAMVGWVAVPAPSSALAAGSCDEGPGASKKCSEKGSAPCGSSKADADARSTFELYAADKGPRGLAPRYRLAGAPDERGVEERLARLEAALEHMGRQLDLLANRLGEPSMPVPPIPPRPPRPSEPRAPRMVTPPPGLGDLFASSGYRPGGEVLVKSYELPEGKLKALTELMVRRDVPVVVSPGADRIEVRATARQHAVFERFINLIHPQNQVRSYHLPHGRLEALAELMVRSDVPVVVEPKEDHLKVHGTSLEQEVFKAYVDLIAPEFGKSTASWSISEGEIKSKKKAKHKAKAKYKKYKKEKKEGKAKRQFEGSKSKAKQQVRRGLEDVLELAVATGPAVATAFAQQVQAQFMEMNEPANVDSQFVVRTTLEGLKSQRLAFEAQARAIEQQTKQFERQARQLERQAAQLEKQAEQLERQAKKLEDKANALRKKADAVEQEKQSSLIDEVNARLK